MKLQNLVFFICIKRSSGDKNNSKEPLRILKNVFLSFFMQPDNMNFRALKIQCSPWFLEFLPMNLKVNTVVQWIGTV